MTKKLVCIYHNGPALGMEYVNLVDLNSLDDNRDCHGESRTYMDGRLVKKSAIKVSAPLPRYWKGHEIRNHHKELSR